MESREGKRERSDSREHPLIEEKHLEKPEEQAGIHLAEVGS